MSSSIGCFSTHPIWYGREVYVDVENERGCRCGLRLVVEIVNVGIVLFVLDPERRLLEPTDTMIVVTTGFTVVAVVVTGIVMVVATGVTVATVLVTERVTLITLMGRVGNIVVGLESRTC